MATGEYTQVYQTVNAVTKQAFGREDLAVYEEKGLISLGDYLFTSNSVETWFNTLVMRIGKTIISARDYKGKFNGILRDNMEWGGVMQKISFLMPEAVEDQSFGLSDGTSVDMYKISKPKFIQKLFYKSAPYQFAMTFYKQEQLDVAFTGAAQMDAFFNGLYTAIQNKLEVVNESMGRNCVNNYIAEVGGGTREIKLVTMYNTEKGLLKDAQLTPATALFSDDFLRYCVAKFQEYSDGFEDMGINYNDGSIERHTPKAFQRMYLWTRFSTALSTVTLWQAFNKEYLNFMDYQNINFFQSSKAGNQNTVKVQRASDESETTVENIVGVLFDYEALGTCREKEWASTTPFNSAGGYYNTFWHYNKAYFNDLSENFILFTLN